MTKYINFAFKKSEYIHTGGYECVTGFSDSTHFGMRQKLAQIPSGPVKVSGSSLSP